MIEVILTVAVMEVALALELLTHSPMKITEARMKKVVN